MYLTILGVVVGAATLALLLIALVVRLVQRARGTRRPGFWKWTFALALALAIVHAFVSTPFGMAWFLVHQARTRGDEKFYAGPTIAADGAWELQERQRSFDPGAELDSDEEPRPFSPYRVEIVAADGVMLRGFLVPPRTAPPRFVAVLTHGLWRGALEIEHVGAMLRDLGGEVLLLELRNHGYSGKAAFTFGLNESNDVLAAVAFVRARAELQDVPLVLFGVSLGSAATALAAPKVEHLAALVLDAPIDSIGAVADRMIGSGGGGRRRRAFMPDWAWPQLRVAFSFWSGVSIDRIAPKEALKALAPSVHALVIGGGEDRRCPPEAAQAVFDAIAAPADAKTLWIHAGSDHGKVWLDAPDEYRVHLAALVDAIAPAQAGEKRP